ncbi:MAG: HPr family phosphocarrier protein [Clostridia bacterium]|jgi:phosphocarrier protein HPr
MLRKEFKIVHEEGLRARPAALFVQVASKFTAQIWIEQGDKKVNAKSIMGVLSLGVSKDDTIQLVANGEDEKEAMDAMETLIMNNFENTEEILS